MIGHLCSSPHVSAAYILFYPDAQIEDTVFFEGQQQNTDKGNSNFLSFLNGEQLFLFQPDDVREHWALSIPSLCFLPPALHLHDLC